MTFAICFITLYFFIGLTSLFLDDSKSHFSFKNKILYLLIWPIIGI